MLCCIWLEPVESRTRCRNEICKDKGSQTLRPLKRGRDEPNLFRPHSRSRRTATQVVAWIDWLVARVMPTDDSVTTFLTVELFGPEISGSRAALDRKFGALVARGASVHFLQKLAHCIELRAEAFQSPDFNRSTA